MGPTGGKKRPSGHKDSGSGESTLYGDGGSNGMVMSEMENEWIEWAQVF